MEFKKIREGRYSLKLDLDIDNEIYNILNSLSLDQLDKYEPTINRRMYDMLISRRISSEFFKQNIDLPSIGFCVVEVICEYFSKYVEVSVGRLPVEEEVRLSGPLYSD